VSAFVLPLICCAAVLAQTPGSIRIEPGVTTQRSVGAATFLIHVDQKMAEVDVQVQLSGQIVSERQLTPDASVLTLDQRNGDAGIQGSLHTSFGYPQQQSLLSGDFYVVQSQVRQGVKTQQRTPYRGDLVLWEWEVPAVVKRWQVWLTPELSAETTLLLNRSQTTQIQLVTVGQVIANVSLANGVNDAVLNQGSTVGTVHIDAGMTFHMQPATPLQDGNVVLSGTFSSSSHPDVKYAGAIANWSYLSPRPEKGSFP
jgi:hypothetical protein